MFDIIESNLLYHIITSNSISETEFHRKPNMFEYKKLQIEHNQRQAIAIVHYAYKQSNATTTNFPNTGDRLLFCL